MTWIKTIAYEDAEGSLLKLYDNIKGPKTITWITLCLLTV